eukprot:s4269_g7.t1
MPLSRESVGPRCFAPAGAQEYVLQIRKGRQSANGVRQRPGPKLVATCSASKEITRGDHVSSLKLTKMLPPTRCNFLGTGAQLSINLAQGRQCVRGERSLAPVAKQTSQLWVSLIEPALLHRVSELAQVVDPVLATGFPQAVSKVSEAVTENGTCPIGLLEPRESRVSKWPVASRGRPRPESYTQTLRPDVGEESSIGVPHAGQLRVQTPSVLGQIRLPRSGSGTWEGGSKLLLEVFNQLTRVGVGGVLP